MPSTSPSIAGSGVEGKEDRKKASPSPLKESVAFPSVTYDPPPASWFFARGGKNGSNPNENSKPQKNPTQDMASQLKASAASAETQDRSNSSNIRFSSTENNLGMVSDNDEEDDHEGFNFIAISNSLLMAGRSFENVPESSSAGADADADSRTSSDKQQGLLIVDGIASDCENNADNSVLTIPGSDSLPSDIGTICHHEDEDDEEEDRSDPLSDRPRGYGSGHQDQRGDIFEDSDSYSNQPLVHRFLKNLQKTRRLRKVSDASDVSAGFHSSDVSVVRNGDEKVDIAHLGGLDLLKFFLRKRAFPLLFFVFAAVANYSWVSQRNQKMAWELRLQEEKEATKLVLIERENLRQEIENLLEDLALASARADSLAKEQERLILEREEAEKAEKERLRLLEEEAKRQEQETRNQKRRRRQPWRSNEQDFGWFFDDSNEECNSHDEGESNTYTIADNCWIKAKADINLGNCGGETKDYFKDIWYGLWEDWDYFAFDEATAVEPFPKEENDGNGKSSMKIDTGYYQIGSGDERTEHDDSSDYQDDTYYPEQDPLQDLFSVIHSAGQSLVNTLSGLISDEAEITQKAARDMEGTVWQKYDEASDTVADAVQSAKEDIRQLSKEALSALRTAVENAAPDKERVSPSPEAQEVTRKGLYDAAAAVTSLSKSWQEYAKSLSVVGEGAEQ